MELKVNERIVEELNENLLDQASDDIKKMKDTYQTPEALIEALSSWFDQVSFEVQYMG